MWNHKGNDIEKKIKSPEASVKAESRMSISYIVPVSPMPSADQMSGRNEYDEQIRSNKDAERTYPWPARQELQGYIPDFHNDVDQETTSDMSLKPFKENNALVDHDALSNEGFTETPGLRRHISKTFNVLRSRQPSAENALLPRHKRLGRHRHHFKENGLQIGKMGLIQPTSKSSETGLLVLPSGGPNKLSEDIRIQLEDDQLLRKAAKQAFNNDEGNIYVSYLNSTILEKNRWLKAGAAKINR